MRVVAVLIAFIVALALTFWLSGFRAEGLDTVSLLLGLCVGALLGAALAMGTVVRWGCGYGCLMCPNETNQQTASAVF